MEKDKNVKSLSLTLLKESIQKLIDRITKISTNSLNKTNLNIIDSQLEKLMEIKNFVSNRVDQKSFFNLLFENKVLSIGLI